MAKQKNRFVCQECGYETARWQGNCPGCGNWNTLVEEKPRSEVKASVIRPTLGHQTRPKPLREFELTDEIRLRTGVLEFDRVMGGGIMQSSLTLIAGDPGIGKSTLMTEIGKYLENTRILYVTGEESGRQVKLRAERLGVRGDNFLLFPETNIEEIIAAVQDTEPEVMVVDSIQTVFRPDLT
ncbi:MAG TPA: ATPase domain-containing protein, partial [Rhodothermales bacterium]|nr:ATPase domain-containing protein [Rhodothermales bacterium]